ncbi:MAG: MoaD/ThiS family protein [Candidatus Rokubacteria bacterium]|nr:MoaD/ThiS family protein [Candidatus Rokubacteria bacterium]
MTGASRVVSVKFLGFLQRLAGRREARVEIEEGATVMDLLAHLADGFGPEFAAAIFRAPREAHAHLRVFLNEEEAGVTDPVPAGGEGPASVAVLILPVFEGGSG